MLGRRLRAIEAFAGAGRRVRLFVQDEARMGLHLPRYRRLTARGVAPKQPFEPLYEWYWLYGAVEPATGEGHFWELPALDAECFSLYLSKLSQACADTLNVVVLDGAPAHVAGTVVVPENVVLVRLPPYSPELNPVERLWLYVRKRLDVFDEAVRTNLEGLREHVAEIVRTLTPSQLSSLTGYSYLLDAVNALSS